MLRRHLKFGGLSSLGLLVLGGCATYTPRPLDMNATSKPAVAELRYEGELPAQLTLAEIDQLLLDNNRELIAARTQHGVAGAQVRQAGILPNPVLNASYADVLSGPGAFAALAAGLSQDLKAIITLSSKRNAAKASAQAVDATVLWQEWQLLGKARLSAVDIAKGEKQLALLDQNAALWRDRVAKNGEALARGDVTLVTIAPDVAASADAQKQFDDFERALATKRRDLNLMLGLSPDVQLRFSEDLRIPSLDIATVREQLKDLPNRRPDLIALQLGYHAQEEKLRGAILAQFPLFSLGVAYGRDTSNVRTLGPQVTMDLPIFDRNQGATSLEAATREQLHSEFSARLQAARSEVEGLLTDYALLQRQLASKKELLDRLDRAAASAQSAFETGDIDERTYVDIIATRNSKRQEVLALQLTLLEQDIAITALTGAGMPHAEFKSDTLTTSSGPST